MKKKMTCVLAILLSIALLTGCGSTSGETAAQTESTPQPGTSSALTEAAADERTVYQAEYVSVTGETLTSSLENGMVLDGELYFTSLGVIEDRTPEDVIPDWPEQYLVYGPVLCRVSQDGTAERIPYVPEIQEEADWENSGSVFSKLCASHDGALWILENRYHTWHEAPAGDPNYTDSLQSEEEYVLVKIQKDGTVVSEFPLNDLGTHAEETASANGTYAFDIADIAEDADGRICLAVSEWFAGAGSYVEDNRICVLDSQSGELVKTIPLQSAPEALVALADGRIAVAYYEGASQTVGFLSEDAAEISAPVAIGDYMDRLTAAENMLYYSAGDGFFRMDPESGEAEKITGWSECDVLHSSTESICLLPDGKIVTVTGEQKAGEQKNELILLVPTAVSQIPQKKTLRLAVSNMYSFTRDAVSRFNRSNQEYRIEVTDYSEYDDYSSSNPEDWNAGINRLQTEIIAGEMPDILDISLLSADRLGAKGILVDLYPYIDADPELKRSDLLENVLQAFEENGKLYQTVSNFYILTTAGAARTVGEKMGWTMEQVRAAMEMLRAEHPESTVFDPYMTRDNVLTFLLYFELEHFVDWNDGKCSFDSDAFTELLAFVKSFPTTYDWSQMGPADDSMNEDARLYAGLQLMKMCNFSSFEDLQINSAGLMDAGCTFVGYPTESGVGSMYSQLGNSFAITSACADRDAAWEFIRMFFLPSYQEQFVDGAFPTNRQVYEEKRDLAMTVQYERNPDGSFAVDADGNRVEADLGTIEVGGQAQKIHTVTEEEAQRVEEIIQGTANVLRVDDALKSIVVEEAEAYFADQRSVEETARLIQSKASIYVNEQR